mmetsp:Transcript_7390/g.17804  ORF Transcript_7390/g.17804 Transcript_7390/m.17804 type:complete len:248 (+) Transcript_7390:417-1160(+)
MRVRATLPSCCARSTSASASGACPWSRYDAERYRIRQALKSSPRAAWSFARGAYSATPGRAASSSAFCTMFSNIPTRSSGRVALRPVSRRASFSSSCRTRRRSRSRARSSAAPCTYVRSVCSPGARPSSSPDFRRPETSSRIFCLASSRAIRILSYSSIRASKASASGFSSSAERASAERRCWFTSADVIWMSSPSHDTLPCALACSMRASASDFSTLALSRSPAAPAAPRVVRSSSTASPRALATL